MPLSHRDRSLLYAELAKLTKAGFGVTQSLEMIQESGVSSTLRSRIHSIHTALTSGSTITQAFQPLAIEPDVNLIAAGEKCGRLEPTFQHLADYYRMLADARRECFLGLIRPLPTLYLAACLGPITELIRGTPLSSFLPRSLLILLAAHVVVLILAWLIRSLLIQARENAALDRLFTAIPWIGKARRNLALARYTRVYQGGILAGLSMREVVAHAANASLSGAIKEAAARLRTTLDSGMPLGPTYQSEPAFPKTFAASYSTAEASGTLDSDLNRWAHQFQDEALRHTHRAATLLPKFAYLLVAGFVVWKIISFYLGYSSMLESLDP